MSTQPRQPAGVPEAGQFGAVAHTRPEVSLPSSPTFMSSVDYDLVVSRRALLDVLAALEGHAEALTVLGGHAVAERTIGVPGVPAEDTTRDADIGVLPSLLSDTPHLDDAMTTLGYERVSTERPGVWTKVIERELPTYERVGVDLIAPYALSYEPGERKPRRGACVGKHGPQSVSASVGTELSTIDRSLLHLRSFDHGPGRDAYVAGTTALLCAKAHKLHDRLAPKELSRNPRRLRPKDFADVYRLLIATPFATAREIFAAGESEERIAEAVSLGRHYLTEILADTEFFAEQVADQWADESVALTVEANVRAWLKGFRA